MGRASGARPTVTISYQCLYLWQTARAALHHPTHVVWLYEDSTGRIGLRPSPPIPGACRVTKLGTVATTKFFRQHGIVVMLGARVTAEMEGDTLMFAIPLGPDAAYGMI